VQYRIVLFCGYELFYKEHDEEEEEYQKYPILTKESQGLQTNSIGVQMSHISSRINLQKCRLHR